MKEKKELDSTTNSRVYKIIRTIPHLYDDWECGAASVCKTCTIKKHGTCRLDRVEQRSWKQFRKKQWKEK